MAKTAKAGTAAGPRKAALEDLGAHISVAGGLERCFERGDALGARTLQIFCKNQRQWKGRPLGDFEVGRFRREWRGSKVRDVIAHATYLVNLATDDGVLRRKSITCLGYELQCGAALGLAGVVVHPGSNENGPDHGIGRIVESIEQIADEPGYAGSALLLETTAGQGSAIGHRLEHLESIIRGLTTETAERVGICLDTCHLHAAGYDVSTAKGWRALLSEIDDRISLGRLRAIHVNDSQGERGSRVDRHANIGEGTIGLKGFKAMLETEALFGVPKVLETPEADDGHRRDLDTLIGLVS